MWISGMWESKRRSSMGVSQCLVSEMSGSLYRTNMLGSVQDK